MGIGSHGIAAVGSDMYDNLRQGSLKNLATRLTKRGITVLTGTLKICWLLLRLSNSGEPNPLAGWLVQLALLPIVLLYSCGCPQLIPSILRGP